MKAVGLDRVLLWLCWPSGSPPAAAARLLRRPPIPGGTGERISGNERLGWNQAATGAGELATFRYAAYVDGTRVELDRRVLRRPERRDALPCNSRMPAMSPGAHSIELASFVSTAAPSIESGRSAALRVTVTGATAGGPPPAPRCPAPLTALLTTGDGVELRLDVLVGCSSRRRPRSPSHLTAASSSPNARAVSGSCATACSIRSRRSPSTKC